MEKNTEEIETLKKRLCGIENELVKQFEVIKTLNSTLSKIVCIKNIQDDIRKNETISTITEFDNKMAGLLKDDKYQMLKKKLKEFTAEI